MYIYSYLLLLQRLLPQSENSIAVNDDDNDNNNNNIFGHKPVNVEEYEDKNCFFSGDRCKSSTLRAYTQLGRPDLYCKD
jgi:hypothetical protein